MSLFASWIGSDCAVQVTSKTVAAMMSGRGGAPPWHGEVDVPAGAVSPALQGENLDAAALRAPLKELVGSAPRKIGSVTLVLPDACARLRIVPIETEVVPGKKAGAEIIRWALRDTLPFAEDEALIDTQLFSGGPSARLLVTAAHRDVLRQYEEATAVVGPVVRALPATLACGWNVDDDAARHLLVHADPDTLGCLVSDAEVPLFVRTRPLPESREGLMEAVSETLDYAAERLGVASGRATVSGLVAGDEDLQRLLESRRWSPASGPGDGSEDPRWGALTGALRAAEAGA
jgi:hypothetical protein